MTKGKRNYKNISGDIADAAIGIIGFGHLGSSLAESLVKNGFPSERLLISHRGREATRARAFELGLGGCLADNDELIERSDAVILGIRPQDVLSLPVSSLRSDALVVSCMAGLPSELLQSLLGVNVRRFMCSGPDTILEGRGISAMCRVDEEDKRIRRLLAMMGLEVLDVSSEEELDSFTVGICIPAMLLNMRIPRAEVLSAMDSMEKIYPVYGSLRHWIAEVTPEDAAKDSEQYLENVCTKGGVTEAMTVSLREGAAFEAALHRGIERGREITCDVMRKIDAVRFGQQINRMRAEVLPVV
ncbi:MAG: NAD(P)-binding domain-containing protein [Synergistaceae bacterium]|nr:NAD(P)-binding domain-containing protein [Synergistaceae bacterium]